MLAAPGLEQQGGLHEALPQHEVDLEGRTQGIAGIAGARDFTTGLAQERIILAEIDPWRATTGVAEGLRQHGREDRLGLPVSLGEEAVVGTPILLSLVEPFQGAGDGFGLLPAQQAQAQMDELEPGPGIQKGERRQPEQSPHALQERGGFHVGRLRRSKVFGAVRLKVFWSSTFLVRALTRDSRRSGRW